MGCRILYDDDNDRAALYCSTTERAFGPVFNDDGNHDARERAELFIDWIAQDPRRYTDQELTGKYYEFLSLEESLWAEKDKENDD